MATTTTTVPADPRPCPAPASAGDAVGRQPLFPPPDADPDAYRRWLAASPWPEVVFASAGGR